MSQPLPEHHDPFQPAVPRANEHGRLLTHGQLVAGWSCRWCIALLSTTPDGAVVCLTCDLDATSTLETHPDA